MANILVIDKYWKRVEIDLDDPDPLLRTHCAICLRPLFPEWQNKNGNREIGENAVAAICWKCSMYGPDKMLKIRTDEEMKEERKADNKQRARERRKFYVPKKKRKKALEKRVEALSHRPCGCSLKGRHKSTCKHSQGYKAKDKGSD